MDAAPVEVTLTASQREQLATFLEERGHTGPVIIRPALSLGDSYLEAILVGLDGERIAPGRVLFP